MTKAIAFRPRDDAQEKAVMDFMRENDIDQTQAMRKIIDIALDMENRFDILDEPCPALCYIDDHYECTWGRMGRTPDTKKIGKAIEAVKNRCSACKKTLDMKDKLLTLEQKVARGFVADIPSCIHGGQISEDGEKIYCKNPHMVSQYRDVKKWCRVVRNGANCEALRWSKVHIKGKLPDGQNL